MKQEPHELEERAQEARHDSSLAPVSVTMAVLAVLVAAVSLLGHRAHLKSHLRSRAPSVQSGNPPQSVCARQSSKQRKICLIFETIDLASGIWVVARPRPTEWH